MTHRSVATPELLLQEATDDHIVLASGSLIAVVWIKVTTLGGIAALSAALEQQAASFPGGLYQLTIVEEGASLPAAAERAELTKFLAGAAHHIRRSAVVHEGVGFRAAAVRGVVTGLALLAQLPYPYQVFATLEQAALWLASTDHADPLDANATIAAITRARREARVTSTGVRP